MLIFAVTLFISATLLFLVQPMFAKMVLPLLGGTPAVWNTCMLFFQAMLLAGYGYVHAATERLGVRRQAAMHVGLLFLPLLALPIRIPRDWAPPAHQNPIPWLLVLLLVSVGLPFFLVSTTAPLLQKWFAHTSHPAARDPYFLYGASNLGSMLALLGYPLLLEPNYRLAEQSWVWTGGYGLLVVMTVSCAAILWRSPAAVAQNPRRAAWHGWQGASPLADCAGAPRLGRRAYWVVLSFVPSSLMLGVTTYLTTEVPPIPLLWVIPLAIYLLTFVLAFARRPILPHRGMVRLLPFAVLPLTIWIPLRLVEPLWLFIPFHWLMFFVVAMVCHGELVRSRPPTEQLTEFYLWMAVGGVLGGLFNALVAPVIFRSVVEYPMVLVLACLLRPRTIPVDQRRLDRWLDLGLPVALGSLVAGLAWVGEASGMTPHLLLPGLLIGSALACFAFRHRPIRFALGVGAIMLSIAFSVSGRDRLLHAERSFFGTYRILEDGERTYRVLASGITAHGAQSLDPSRRREPLLYFFRSGPIGQVFATFSGPLAKSHVAIVGLGTGSLACYGETGQQFTFYEIDPVVERIARDPRYFTFLQECAPKIDVILGDARLSLGKAPDGRFGLMVLDAFNSDAIPLHLLTRQALKLYLAKLAEDGVLVFNISNRNLDLRPAISVLAQDAGLVYLVRAESDVSEEERRRGKLPSWWAVMARRREHLRKLFEDPRWTVWAPRREATVWTDDWSNILAAIRWRGTLPLPGERT